MKEVVSKRLESLAREFTVWRRAKCHRTEPIPAELWGKAVRLARSLGKERVAQHLGLVSQDFQAHIDGKSARRAPKRKRQASRRGEKVKIVKLAEVAVDWPSQLPTVGLIEVEGPGGWRLRVARDELPALLKALAQAHQ